MASGDDEKSGKLVAPDTRLQVTVCGGGNGAHAFVVTTAAKFSPRFRVNWLSLYGDEADKINGEIAKNDGYIKGVYCQENVLVYGKPNIVSKNPSKVIPGSDIIVLCVPAFAHTQYLEAINAYHEICSKNENISKNGKKLIIAAFPGASGLEFSFLKSINNHSNVVLFNCLTLPWACRFVEYGKSVEISGIKGEVANYIFGDDKLIEQLKPVQKLQSLFLDNKPILNCKKNIDILTSSSGMSVSRLGVGGSSLNGGLGGESTVAQHDHDKFASSKNKSNSIEIDTNDKNQILSDLNDLNNVNDDGDDDENMEALEPPPAKKRKLNLSNKSKNNLNVFVSNVYQ